MSELLPCPFCGGSNVRIQTDYRVIPAGAMGVGTSEGSVMHEVVWCHSCGTFPHGAAWWNRRASLSRPAYEELEKVKLWRRNELGSGMHNYDEVDAFVPRKERDSGSEERTDL